MSHPLFRPQVMEGLGTTHACVYMCVCVCERERERECVFVRET